MEGLELPRVKFINGVSLVQVGAPPTLMDYFETPIKFLVQKNFC